MTSTYAHAHSGSFITGSPRAGDDMVDYLDAFDDIFQNALDKALAYARNDLREAATANDHWKSYAPLLDVEFDGDSFVYVMTGSPEQNQAMNELEFGGPDARPNSLLRKVAMKQPVFISQIMTDALSGVLPIG